ncbi:receptor expression-enhancing protein 6 isoform X2 [Agrilus planipennis]|nr:receptor expression-enhancing protein 6 isoform X2 [Agrilus planipennis]
MAGKIMDLKNQLEVSLRDKSKPWTTVLDVLEGKTGVDRLFIFIGSVTILGLWLVFGYAGQLVCNTVVFLYPAYVSIKAIESPQKDDDTILLTYWVVYALFSVIEFFADLIVGWFPLYWLAKCIFFIWLMLPSDFNGSLIIYTKFIRPYFLKHEGNIDEAISSASKLLGKDK